MDHELKSIKLHSGPFDGKTCVVPNKLNVLEIPINSNFQTDAVFVDIIIPQIKHCESKITSNVCKYIITNEVCDDGTFYIANYIGKN